jgi:LruC domain-containing protein
MKKNLLFLMISYLIFSGCKKNEAVLDNPNPQNLAPNGFNFGTSKSIDINVKLSSNLGEPLKGIPVSFYFANDTTEVFKSLTDDQGSISSKLNVPSYVDQMVVKPHLVGLIKEANVSIKDNNLTLSIGGENGLSGNVILSSSNSNQDANIKSLSNYTYKILTADFSYMGTYDVNGRPNYLTTKPGRVSAQFLGFLNSSLPEERNVAYDHLVYLSSGANRDLDIVVDGEVFITYISEGATKRNSLAYYTYPTGQKPNSINEINEIKYVYPNASGKGSGGGMISGDRVSLGNINSGNSIGFILVSNGWDKTQSANNTHERFFSNENLNSENKDNLKQHTVVLDYEKEDLVVVGFEDTNRESGKNDDDFNDLLIYLSSSKKNAISKDKMAKLTPPVDSDGDGITDDNDQYPGDSKKAYNTFYPSKTGWGTLAFEDNWPKRGDYDMNDLGVNYRYSYSVNASNQVVEMKGDYKVNKSLAYFKNGFGVELPINQNVIENVRGYDNGAGYIKYNPNGTEAGQDKAVIIPFDNQKAIYNTQTDYSEPIRVIIEFITPQPINVLNAAPYNPFLISDGRRSYEIHLPGQKPTNKADKNLFGSDQDRTNLSQGKYYIGENNWPWALSFVEPFNYPAEGQPVNEAYPKFGAWAASGGTQFKDWYKK